MSDETVAEPMIWRIEPQGDGFKAHLCVTCTRGHEGFCRFSLWRKPAAGIMWQWDGDLTAPTISPSIGCNGGCARHFTMVKGVPT